MSIFDVADIVDHIFEVGNLIEPHVRCVCKAFNRAQRRKIDPQLLEIGCKYTDNEMTAISTWCVNSTFAIFRWYYEYNWPGSENYTAERVMSDDVSDDDMLNNIAWLRKRGYIDTLCINTILLIKGKSDLFKRTGFKYNPTIFITSNDHIIELIQDPSARAILTALPNSSNRQNFSTTIQKYRSYITDSAIEAFVTKWSNGDYIESIVKAGDLDLCIRTIAISNTVIDNIIAASIQYNSGVIYKYMLVNYYQSVKQYILHILPTSPDKIIRLSDYLEAYKLNILATKLYIEIDINITPDIINNIIIVQQCIIWRISVPQTSEMYKALIELPSSVTVYGIANIRCYIFILIDAIKTYNVELLKYILSLSIINREMMFTYDISKYISEADSIELFIVYSNYLYNISNSEAIIKQTRLYLTDARPNIVKYIYSLNSTWLANYTNNLFIDAIRSGRIDVLNTLDTIIDFSKLNIYTLRQPLPPCSKPLSIIWYRRKVLPKISGIENYGREFIVHVFYTSYLLHGLEYIKSARLTPYEWVKLISIGRPYRLLLMRLFINGDLQMPPGITKAAKHNSDVLDFIKTVNTCRRMY